MRVSRRFDKLDQRLVRYDKMLGWIADGKESCIIPKRTAAKSCFKVAAMSLVKNGLNVFQEAANPPRKAASATADKEETPKPP